MTVCVGLPRGLLYYQYGMVWESFFRELGAEVIVSGDTSKETLDIGGELDEVCLPVKVFFGHVHKLYRQVDFLFVPRIISVAKGQYTCPKIIGMPDMLRSNIYKLPPVIDINVNLCQHQRSLYQTVVAVGRMVGKGAAASLYAWFRAWHGRQQHCLLHDGTTRQRIALIGHSYIIYDRQISMNILGRLDDCGFAVITPEMVEARQADAAARFLGKKIFWSYSHHMTGTALALIQPPAPVDGIIFMTSFACGPDALIGEIIKQRANAANTPCIFLTIDEHTAEAGLVTRIEAFADMLKRRRQA